jgi:hypothetical protein
MPVASHVLARAALRTQKTHNDIERVPVVDPPRK